MTPKFTIDENLPPSLADWLRGRQCEAVLVQREARGATDSDILRWAMQEGRIVVTADKDFGALVFRRRIRAAGVVLVRYPYQGTQEFITKWTACWARIEPIMVGNFVILEERSIRVRALPD